MQKITCNFPFTTQLTGALLGNGITGAMFWGQNNLLNISIGGAGLWDHRGGMPWTEQQNYSDIRAALEAGNLEKIREFFVQIKENGASRPTLVPVGRVAITLPENARLSRYELNTATGLLTIFYLQEEKEKSLEFAADLTQNDVLCGSGFSPEISIRIIPSYDLSENSNYPALLSEHRTLREHGFVPPEQFVSGNLSGFIQPMPADPSYSLVGHRQNDGTFSLTFQRKIDQTSAFDRHIFTTFAQAVGSSEKYFSGFWQTVPEISYHVPELQRAYCHNMYKYAVITNPAGIVPGLQGPWLEDDRLPPWSGDYHLNINTQMYMHPGLKAGCFTHLKHFFDLVLSWKTSLRHNARCFAGIDNGYMLPHAVDDRGVCMGGFWTGTIDHACSAWVAQMMFDYCRYSGDIEFLRNEVYDFMHGVLQVYHAFLETGTDGKLCMPLSTSPEYRESKITAWGCNASFQLAAVHQLARNLILAAKMLNITPDDFALQIRQDLPLYCGKDGEIALWEDLLLEESHRHHSHLAGICPFEVIDPMDGKYRELIAKSLERWVNLGMGRWAGWSMPWASQIYSRCANGNAAELILKIWLDCFTKDGGGVSLHDGRYKGFTIIAQCRGEVMQIDGGMGLISAIQDQFMHVYDDEIRLFYGIAQEVRNVSFNGIYAPNKLKVSGKIDVNGQIFISLSAADDTPGIRLSLRDQASFCCDMKAGETLHLTLQHGKLIRCEV